MATDTATELFGKFEAKFKAEGLGETAISAFRRNFVQLVAGATGMIPESEIDPATPATVPYLKDYKRDASIDVPSLLSKAAVIKLNGGLGTSMGLEKAKSLLEVKGGKSFIDLIMEQVIHLRKEYNSQVKFILMDSFSTSDDTRAALAAKFPEFLKEADWELLQNKVPKVTVSALEPVSYPADPELEWCPPGHGDIYTCLVGSGLMDRLLSQGVRYIFVSNSDNLGATLDIDVLAYFATSGKPFMMEVCERLDSDKKGGHLCIRKSDSSFILRESNMCLDSDKAAFEDITKHRYFNTNNLWVDLEALKKAYEEFGGSLPLPLIKNKKTVNPRDSSTTPVFQLETAMGSAIECFKGAGALCVPRERFAPVKTTSDLFVLRSDAYEISPDSVVRLTAPQLPMVKLDDKHYKLVDQLEALMDAPPSLAKCTALTVSGPVHFAKGVAFEGAVKVSNKGAAPAALAAGTYTGEVEL